MIVDRKYYMFYRTPRENQILFIDLNPTRVLLFTSNQGEGETSGNKKHETHLATVQRKGIKMVIFGFGHPK